MRWARKRSGKTLQDLETRFKKLPGWEEGKIQPTVRQLEAFAHAAQGPIGYLFLSEPPDEVLPLSDFRIFTEQSERRPSPNPLSTIYACQRRQNWYLDFAIDSDLSESVRFVGSTTLKESPENVAANMRRTLGIDLPDRRGCSRWMETLNLFSSPS